MKRTPRPRRHVDVEFKPASYVVNTAAHDRTNQVFAATYFKLRKGFVWEESMLDGYKLFMFRRNGRKGLWKVVDPASGRWPLIRQIQATSRVDAVCKVKELLKFVPKDKMMDRFMEAVLGDASEPKPRKTHAV